MILSDYVNTFGQFMRRSHGARVHKVTIDAGFTCPNRDGTKARGGCTFCNNRSFHPADHTRLTITAQVQSGQACVVRRTGAQSVIAYFQTYTNTYANLKDLEACYDEALSVPGVIGLSIGTRPDCLEDDVVARLARYRDDGWVVWIELGLQSSFNQTLARVRRGHTFGDYQQAVVRLRRYRLPICTHLIIGLPGEHRAHALQSLRRVLECGVDGLKLHPLHVVRGTALARDWRAGLYTPLSLESYVSIVADLVEHTPKEVTFHRLTGTASANILLAPQWCGGKWSVLNAITAEFVRRRTHQGYRALPNASI